MARSSIGSGGAFDDQPLSVDHRGQVRIVARLDDRQVGAASATTEGRAACDGPRKALGGAGVTDSVVGLALRVWESRPVRLPFSSARGPAP